RDQAHEARPVAGEHDVVAAAEDLRALPRCGRVPPADEEAFEVLRFDAVDGLEVLDHGTRSAATMCWPLEIAPGSSQSSASSAWIISRSSGSSGRGSGSSPAAAAATISPCRARSVSSSLQRYIFIARCP